MRDIAFLDQFASQPSGVVEHGNQIYEVVSQDWRGYIVAGSLSADTFPNGPLYGSPLMPDAPTVEAMTS